MKFPDSCTHMATVASDKLVSSTDTTRVYLRVEDDTGRQIEITQRYFAGGWQFVMRRVTDRNQDTVR